MYATKTVSSQTTSGWIPMDDNQAAFNASVAVTVSGTLTYSVEFTLDNVQDPTITPTVFSTTLTGATTSQSLAVHYPVKAFRLNVTAFTSGSATITVLQGSSWDGAATVGNSLLGELTAIYRPAPFLNFSPRLIASLVASSTADCTSGVVTVTATAHAIPASTFDGYPIYYPGSPSLAAGFYENLLVIDANSFTFNAPLAANFLSESVNGGAILTAEVTVASMIIPANTFTVGDFVETLLFRRHSSTAGTKLTNLYYGTSNVGDSSSSSTATVFSIPNMIFLCEKQTTQRGVRGLPGNYTASARNGTMDIGTDKTLSIAHSLTAASDWIMTYGCKMRIF